jgi:Xaa-Pro aminopeptidase
MSNSNSNLSELRITMKELEVDALLISMFNSFGNFESGASDIEIVSGFSGSNGKALVTMDTAILLTDGRYVKQAERQIDTSKWKVEMYPAVDSNSMIARYLTPGQKLGVMSESVSYGSYSSILNLSNDIGLNVKLVKLPDIFAKKPLNTKIYMMDEKDFGESIAGRIKRVESVVGEHESVLIADKSLIGWTFGVRMSQQVNDRSIIPNCIAIVHRGGKPVLFCDLELPEPSSDFEFAHLDKFEEYVSDTSCVNFDFSKVTARFPLHLQDRGLRLRDFGSKKTMFFSVKNETEIRNQKDAAWRTSVAFMKVLAYVEKCDSSTEIGVSELFEKELSKYDDFVGLSFNPISSFGSSTAFVHYNPYACGDKEISGEGLFLLDGGGHFRGATTDMTRVIYRGEPVDELKSIYTSILKSVISFSAIKFPNNSKTCQIDSIARFNLWNKGHDYSFGTGHGVGAFGTVHEYPRISPQCNDIISHNMIVTVEPGVYKDDFGIRLENMLLTKDSAADGFIEFETINYIPFCRKLVDVSSLNSDDIKWLNDYNNEIRNRLSCIPDMEDSVKSWVYKNTETI